LWDPRSGAFQTILRRLGAYAYPFDLAPCGRLAFVVTRKRVAVCDLDGPGGPEPRVLTPPEAPYALALSPPPARLPPLPPPATPLALGEVDPVPAPILPGRVLVSCAFAPDGSALFALEQSGAVVRWDLAAARAESLRSPRPEYAAALEYIVEDLFDALTLT